MSVCVFISVAVPVPVPARIIFNFPHIGRGIKDEAINVQVGGGLREGGREGGRDLICEHQHHLAGRDGPQGLRLFLVAVLKRGQLGG